MNKTQQDIFNERKFALILLGRKIVDVNVDGEILDLELDNGQHFIFEVQVVVFADERQKKIRKPLNG